MLHNEKATQSLLFPIKNARRSPTGTDMGPPTSVAPAIGRRANELDGKTWMQDSISIWSDLRKTRAERDLRHPALFPLALASRLIEIFTNHRDRLVLDPFAGVGTTLVAAQRLHKCGIGLELNPHYIATARSRFTQRTMFDTNQGAAILHWGSALDVLKYVVPGSVDLVVTSPPYWDILMENRTADGKEQRAYGAAVADLGKIADYREFLHQLTAVFQQVFLAMRPGAYCCVVVMDLRKKNRFYPLHSDVAGFMLELGFLYDDLIIWDRRHEYNNLRPLGYPAVFRVNKVHEFIVIFQKPK